MDDRLDEIRAAHSEAEIQAAATAAGGFSKESFAKLGVPYPPPAGWRKRLVENWVLLQPTTVRRARASTRRADVWAAATARAQTEAAVNAARVNAGETFAGQQRTTGRGSSQSSTGGKKRS